MDQYRKEIHEYVFLCMEASSQSLQEVYDMPYSMLFEYIKWKKKFEEEKVKMLESENQNS